MAARFANAIALNDHFQAHGPGLGAKTAAEYEARARQFMAGVLPAGVLEKRRQNGDTIRYNPQTEEFAVVSAKGTIRTYMKPDPAMHGYPTNRDYFDAQQ